MPYADPAKRRQLTLNHYHANKKVYQSRSDACRKRARDHILAIKKRSACLRCGESHPATLDFHHRDPAEKEISANHMVKGRWSPAEIDKELAKCDVLCANCHRKEHWSGE